MTTGAPPSVPLPAAVQTYLMWRWPFEWLEWRRSRQGGAFAVHTVDQPPYVVMSEASEGSCRLRAMRE